MTSLEESQRQLYHKKFLEFGDDSKSLSWNDRESQFMRFNRITELFRFERSDRFSVHEIGCGLGHFKEFLDCAGHGCEYSGSDIVADFIERDREKYPGCLFLEQSIGDDFESIRPQVKGKDYYCLSGTFYTKENNSSDIWESFIHRSMENMFRMANKGICVNFLTSGSDYFDGKLYYADPGRIIDFVFSRLSRFVTITHDLPLFEFFVYIYKEDFIRSQFPGYEKYFGRKA
jgi:hypothetical protein